MSFFVGHCNGMVRGCVCVCMYVCAQVMDFRDGFVDLCYDPKMVCFC